MFFVYCVCGACVVLCVCPCGKVGEERRGKSENNVAKHLEQEQKNRKEQAKHMMKIAWDNTKKQETLGKVSKHGPRFWHDMANH